MKYVVIVLLCVFEGRWVHPMNPRPDVQRDWEICKAEVLAGQEYQKDTMAGGINLSGCMRSKGYRDVEEAPSASSRTESR